MSDLVSVSNGIVTFNPTSPCLLGAAINGPSGFVTLAQQLPISGAYSVPISESGTLITAFNRSTYSCVGSIGNSGSSAADHTPIYIGQIAVDSSGSVYSINNWDEAGADFKKWDKDGNSVYDARYQLRNGNPTSLGYAITVDNSFIYVSSFGNGPSGTMPQYIRRFNISDGSNSPFTDPSTTNGFINVYDDSIVNNVSDLEQRLFRYPLNGLLSYNDILYVSDYIGNRILKFDSTGKNIGQIDITSPLGLTVGLDDTIYIARKTKVSSYKNGVIRDVIVGLKNCQYISASKAGTLYIVDTEEPFIRRYDIHKDALSYKRGFGYKNQFGDINGIAVDEAGAYVYVSQNESNQLAYDASGSKLGKYLINFSPVWTKYCNEFASTANYHQSDPAKIYSSTCHLYHNNSESFAINTDSCYKRYGGGGPVRIVQFGNNKFLYTVSGDGAQIYRIIGDKLKLAGLIGGSNPMPDGSQSSVSKSWTWSDIKGNGIVDIKDVKNSPLGYWWIFAFPDHQGNIWHARPDGLFCLPVGLLDINGNPTYDWSNNYQVKVDNSLSVQCGIGDDDNSIYISGWNQQITSANSPFWMGFQILAKIDKTSGNIIWWTKLPEVCTCMDLIPDKKGIIVGGGASSILYHYTQDGLLIGSITPNSSVGRLDNQGCISVNRNPKDNGIDIFVQDDYISRIIRYSIFENINTFTL